MVVSICSKHSVFLKCRRRISMMLMLCTHHFANIRQPVTMLQFCEPFTMFFTTSPTFPMSRKPVSTFTRNFRILESTTTFQMAASLDLSPIGLNSARHHVEAYRTQRVDSPPMSLSASSPAFALFDKNIHLFAFLALASLTCLCWFR